MPFDAIIFDCDGVMINSEELGIQLELAHLAEHGLTYSRHDFIDLYMGCTDKAAQEILEREFQSKLGRSAPDAFGSGNVEARLALYEKELIAVDGIKDLIRSIDRPKAVASSSKAKILEKKLAWTGLDALTGDHVYSGEYVENSKPAPDLFLYTADKLSVDPANCLVIEDSVNGVKAGAAAGMTVWGFIGGGHLDESFRPKLHEVGAVEVFGHHDEIRERLATL